MRALGQLCVIGQRLRAADLVHADDDRARRHCQSLHQLLLFPGQRTQHGLQLGEQRTLDRLPIGGEGTTQAVHGLFD